MFWGGYLLKKALADDQCSGDQPLVDKGYDLTVEKTFALKRRSVGSEILVEVVTYRNRVADPYVFVEGDANAIVATLEEALFRLGKDEVVTTIRGWFPSGPVAVMDRGQHADLVYSNSPLRSEYKTLVSAERKSMAYKLLSSELQRFKDIAAKASGS